ncbi:MAG: lytic transglycosylase domain-containing protein [Bacteroidales bacterium]
MKRYLLLIFSIAMIAIACVVVISARDVIDAKQEMPLVTTVTNFPEIPESLDFCDETIDLARYDHFERFDRELSSFVYMHSTTGLLIKRANRIFPIIDPILKEEGVPEDFKYLAVIESSLNPRAISPAKAVGLWQIMPSTGKELGLEVNDSIDERFHIEKASRAACKYLKRSYNRYGSWALVAASYNGGMGRISRELKLQEVDSFFDLWLTEETLRYVYRILAVKQIFESPYRYGFIFKSHQLYYPIETKSVSLNTTLPTLVSLAKSEGVTYAQLKEFNPWIRGRGIPNKSGKSYEVTVPLKRDMIYSRKRSKVYDSKWVVD